MASSIASGPIALQPSVPSGFEPPHRWWAATWPHPGYTTWWAWRIMPMMPSTLVQLQWQPVRIGEEREPLAGVLINPHRLDDHAPGLELPHGLLHVGELE